MYGFAGCLVWILLFQVLVWPSDWKDFIFQPHAQLMVSNAPKSVA
jgi:hypothetical protein